MRHLHILAIAILSCLSLTAHAARQALVIGNDNYSHITPLKNARADAKAIAQALGGAGFNVTLVLDQSRSGMNAAVRRFKSSVAGGDEAVVFYSGHGVQLGGANYLLPIDLKGDDEDQIKDDAVQLQRVLDDLAEQKAKFSLAIIDACRDNPFKGKGRNFATRGLAPTSAASGQMIIFSAGAGQQALDRLGDKDRAQNSVFTRVLLKEIEKGGQPVDRALKNVRTEVVRLAKSVGHEQVPAIYDQSIGDFFFKRGAGTQAATAAPTSVTVEDSIPAVEAPNAENELWSAAQAGNTADDYETYLAQYPQGRYATEAQMRLSKLKQAAQASAAQRDKDAWAQAEKLASLEGYRAYLETFPQGLYGPLAQTRLKRLEAAGGSSGKAFKDCTDCPEMVNIPAGRFEMGSPSDEVGRSNDEGPTHSVTLPAFALGKLEVTRGQFAAFVRDTGYSTGDKCWTFASGKWEERSGSWRDPGYAQEDGHPVACVSANDAQAYINWLTKKTGKAYRLPSEAEWEYAARAGTTTARYWGNDADAACGFANVMDQAGKAQVPGVTWVIHNCSDGMAYTAPSGRYRPNAFGLHDMIGNVWEWTADCWNESYAGAPTNGQAWSSGDCGRRVRRGGSWNVKPQLARSADRVGYSSGSRYYIVGFRVAISSARTN